MTADNVASASWASRRGCWGLLAFVFLSLCVLGCDTGTVPAQNVSTWVLHESGETIDIELPMTIPVAGTEPRRSYDLRADVVLAQAFAGVPLTLSIPRLDATAQLFVDGVEAAPLHFEPQSRYRVSGAHRWHIPTEATADGRIELTLRVQDAWTQARWFLTVPRLTRANEVDRQTVFVSIVNSHAPIVGFANLFVVGVLYLFIYVSDRRRKTHRSFAIQGLCASYYPLHACGYTQLVFGVYDALIVAVSLFVALLFSVYFFHQQFRLGPPSSAWSIGIGLEIVVTLVFSDPYEISLVGAPLVAATLATVCAYAVGRSLLLVARGQGTWAIGLYVSAWLILGLTALPDGFGWVGLAEVAGGARPASLGLSAYALLQAIILAREHTEILASREALNRELGERVVQLERRQHDVQSLNSELKRQIVDRSRQLFEALCIVTNPDHVVHALEIGTVVQGRYRVLGQVGQGSMGTVFRVERVSDGRVLVLKQAHRVDRNAFLRLAREAECAARLTHDNIVEIVDVDLSPPGFAFLVLEWLDGVSLDQLHDRYGNMAWALPILHEAVRGLSEIHRRRIVHRDIKPANILVANSGGRLQVKIADFGISRLLDDGPEPLHPSVLPSLENRSASGSGEDETLQLSPADDAQEQIGGVTTLGTILGTPRFLAPELAFGSDAASPAADVWSFGITAFLLLFGDYPFSSIPVISARYGKPLIRPSFAALNLEGCASLVAALERTLDPDPFARPSAEALEREFEAVRQSMEVLDAARPPDAASGHDRGPASSLG